MPLDRGRATDASFQTEARKKFFSSHLFPVPATGLNPLPSSAPAHCWLTLVHPQQVQATLDRSRISTIACLPMRRGNLETPPDGENEKSK